MLKNSEYGNIIIQVLYIYILIFLYNMKHLYLIIFRKIREFDGL